MTHTAAIDAAATWAVPPSVAAPAGGWPAAGEWTYEDYRRLPDDGWRYEVIRGRLYMSPAPRPRHQRSLRGLFRAVDDFVEERGLGEVFFAPIDVKLAGLAEPVQPDLVYLRRERLDLVTETAIEGAPDLEVEIQDMNRRHRRTLEAIFAKPPPANVKWQAVEGLVTALGGEVLHLRGSVVAFTLGDRRGVFHRPHPSPEAKRGQLRRVRRFLEHAGVGDPQGEER